jgi:hypothetical protein
MFQDDSDLYVLCDVDGWVIMGEGCLRAEIQTRNLPNTEITSNHWLHHSFRFLCFQKRYCVNIVWVIYTLLYSTFSVISGISVHYTFMFACKKQGSKLFEVWGFQAVKMWILDLKVMTVFVCVCEDPTRPQKHCRLRVSRKFCVFHFLKGRFVFYCGPDSWLAYLSPDFQFYISITYCWSPHCEPRPISNREK